jgi:hypothetical protein
MSYREKYAEDRRLILENLKYYQEENEPKGVAYVQGTYDKTIHIQTRDTLRRIRSELQILLDVHSEEYTAALVNRLLEELLVEQVMGS